MSKTLIKIVDESILPSLLLVITKIGGLALSIIIFDLSYEIEKMNDGKIIPYLLTFKTTSELMTANSFSNTLMMIVPIIGFLISIYKINHFQDKRLTPQKIIKIADKDLLKLIESSESVYAKAFVWIAFLWLSVILSTINVVNQEAHIWTAAVGISIGLFSTLYLVKNLEIDYTENKKI